MILNLARVRLTDTIDNTYTSIVEKSTPMDRLHGYLY